MDADTRSEADIAAIRNVLHGYDSTTTAGLADQWMSLLSDDIVWMVPEQASLAGRDAVWGRIEALFSALNMEHVSSVDEVRVAGDWAYVRAIYEFQGVPKAGGDTIEEVGKSLMILGRQADGSWRITRAIWNTNNPVQ